jgi:hypothetical protein
MSVNKILVNNLDSNYTHSIFDISEYSGRQYSTLSDALNAIPQAKQKGGMTIRYIDSDNKYVQCRYMSNSTTSADFTNVTNWQGVDDEPIAGSKNLVESGGVDKTIEERKESLVRSTTPDFAVSDEDGNAVFIDEKGELKTKGFNSATVKNDINTLSSTLSSVKDKQDKILDTQRVEGHTLYIY